MKQTRVLIVDDNVEVRRALREYLETQEDIVVVGEAESGVQALEHIADTHVDVMLLDVVMPQLDGFGVLAQMKTMTGEVPKVIMVTALGRDDFVMRALSLGAQYYMIKPVELSVLRDRIYDVANLRPLAREQSLLSPVAPGNSLDEQLANLFLTLGIPAHIKGYHFMREAIKMVVENGELINSITKELYPGIARRFNTTASKVERAIRHAIEVAWARGRMETLNKALGCRVIVPQERPTNGEFIAMIADKLSLGRSA